MDALDLEERQAQSSREAMRIRLPLTTVENAVRLFEHPGAVMHTQLNLINYQNNLQAWPQNPLHHEVHQFFLMISALLATG
jgi:hypothetical protein